MTLDEATFLYASMTTKSETLIHSSIFLSKFMMFLKSSAKFKALDISLRQTTSLAAFLRGLPTAVPKAVNFNSYFYPES